MKMNKASSPAKGSVPLDTLLFEAIKGDYSGFDARLSEVEYKWSEVGLNVAGNFYFPPYNADGEPTIHYLVEWLYHQIIAFCIPQAERDKAFENFVRSRKDRHNIEIHDKARNLFVRARESQKTSGEPGELLLFVLAEAVLKAPQIACKMYLKTSENVPVHGSDCIHAMLGHAGVNLRIVWGESKTYRSLPLAIGKICESLTQFLLNTAGERTPRDRDIDIIKDHLNITDPQLREAIIEYLDPYSGKSNELEEMVACLVVFQAPIYAQVTRSDRLEMEAHFRHLYEALIKESCCQLGLKLREYGLEKIRVHFFLLPVPDVNIFRQSFFQKLGIPITSIGKTEDDTSD